MTQTLKIILIAITSAITATSVTSLYSGDSCHSEIQTQRSIQLLNTKIAYLEQENRKLSTQVKHQNSTMLSPAHQIAEKRHNQLPADSTQLATEKRIPDEQLLRKSENFSKWLADTHKESGSFDLNKEMQLRFDAESVDPYWAAGEEQEYLSLFSQNPELSGLALRETQCRTQQCALTISITDLTQANLLVEKMTAVLRQKNRYPLIIAAPDEQQGITRLYIGKDANSFDFN